MHLGAERISVFSLLSVVGLVGLLTMSESVPPPAPDTIEIGIAEKGILMGRVTSSEDAVSKPIVSRESLTPLHDMTLSVCSGETGNPIPGAEVSLVGLRVDLPAPVADNMGTVRVSSPEGWDGEAVVSAAGFMSKRLVLAGRQDSEVHVVVLERAGALAVELVGSAPGGLPSVSAIAWPTEAASGDVEIGAVQEARFSELGVARFTELIPDCRYSIVVLGGGVVTPAPLVGFLANGQTVTVTPRLLIGAGLALQDMYGATVQREPGVFRDSPMGWRRLPQAATPVSSTGPVGKLLVAMLGGLPPGMDGRDLMLFGVPVGALPQECRFRISVPGFEAETGTVALQPVIDELPVVVVSLNRLVNESGSITAELSGLIGVEKGGRHRLPEAVLHLRDRDRKYSGKPIELSIGVSDLLCGRVDIPALPTGNYEVSLVTRYSRLQHETAIGAVPVGVAEIRPLHTADLRLSFSDVGGLEILATEDQQEFLGPLDVALRRVDGKNSCPVIWHEGPYRLHALPTGEYTVEVRGGFRKNSPSIAWPPVSFVVEAGVVSKVNLQVPVWGTE